MKCIIHRFLLVLIAIFVSVLFAEGIARIFFDPVDYLWRKELPDEMLRYRVEPNTAGHDSWGYRNKSVPERSDIVAIGDSQTYGESALAKYSWPSILQKLTGKEIYNMGLGGYGPAEYFYLMEHKAPLLKPVLIIAGFYLGNDLADTYAAVYSVPYWKDLRNPELTVKEDASADAHAEPVEKKNPSMQPHRMIIKPGVYAVTNWLAGHSVLYRVITATYLGDIIRQNTMIEMGEEITMLEDGERGIHTGFTPERRLQALDLDKPDVREGLELALNFFNKMNELAAKNGLGLLVVIIPTKESVYGDLIEGNSDLQYSEKIDSLLENERRVSMMADSYFKEHNIPFLDLLGPLRSAAKYEQLYPNNYSGHFNENGNRVIAESIKQYLDSKQDN
ncbi:MAG: hypothetical protein ACREOP_09120 [Thermodesulfobacteriota bacterium]